jgi:hypothetical protein
VDHHNAKLGWHSQKVVKGALWVFSGILDLDSVIQRKTSENGDKWLGRGQIDYATAYL